MARKSDPTPEVTTPTKDDANNPRLFEPEGAEQVRNGELSAAQLPGGNGNVDPNEPDAQYPPGVVDNAPQARLNQTDDPQSFVPERKSGAKPQTTSGNPSYSYGTSSEQ